MHLSRAYTPPGGEPRITKLLCLNTLILRPSSCSLETKAVSTLYSSISRLRNCLGGDVIIDATGKPRFNYSLSAYDQVSMQHGLRSALKILLASGAKTLKTNQPTVPVYHVPTDVKLPQSVSDPGFQAWLDSVDAAGLRPGTVCMASAHQMGSLAMGTSRRRGATDPRGRIWGHEKLYVADASLFPTPSGSK